MKASYSTPRRAAAVLAVAIGAALAAGVAVAQSQTPAPADAAPGGMRHGAMHGEKAGQGMHGGRGQHAQHGGGERGARMMQRLDTDGDGQLSRTEVEAGHQAALARRLQAFDAADADRDGKLSAQERQAMRDSMRAQHGGARGVGPGHRHGGGMPQGGAGTPAAPAQPNS
jgi:hypothetical protein